jgi:transcription elongation factor Elf1
VNLKSVSITCPYCGEQTEVDVEPLEEVQTFIEDCRVCCRPVQLEATPGEDGLEVVATRSE